MSNRKNARMQPLQRQYLRLSGGLASIGYITQGSVLDRSTLHPPRSGYQWTRKVANKTITVALSQEQFLTLRRAIQNRRRLQGIVKKMEKLSRQILFGTMADTNRRKPLRKKVLGLL